MSHFMIVFNIIYQFIKPFSDKKKMSIFEEYRAFKYSDILTAYHIFF